jgi:hypothetical protein
LLLIFFRASFGHVRLTHSNRITCKRKGRLFCSKKLKMFYIRSYPLKLCFCFDVYLSVMVKYTFNSYQHAYLKVQSRSKLRYKINPDQLFEQNLQFPNREKTVVIFLLIFFLFLFPTFDSQQHSFGRVNRKKLQNRKTTFFPKLNKSKRPT